MTLESLLSPFKAKQRKRKITQQNLIRVQEAIQDLQDYKAHLELELRINQ